MPATQADVASKGRGFFLIVALLLLARLVRWGLSALFGVPPVAAWLLGAAVALAIAFALGRHLRRPHSAS